MLTVLQAQNFSDDLVARARRLGADAADVVYYGDAATDVQVRLAKLEDVTRAESEDITLRVFIGQRHASSATSDMATYSLEQFTARVIAMAREVPEDAYAGLAPDALLLRGTPAELDLYDGIEVSPEELRDRALAAEDAARGVTGVNNSDGATASVGHGVMALATSGGFAQAYRTSSHSVSTSMIAGAGAAMQTASYSHVSRHLADLERADAIGREAGWRAVKKLNPQQLKSGAMPIVFDPQVGSSMLGHLITAINGSAIARKTSFLLNCLGTKLFANSVNISDNPHLLRGLRSRPFDAEGLPTAPLNLIENGVLTSFLINSTAARQLGVYPTGHATRGGAGASNLHMEAGTISPAALIADIKHGFYVTGLIGMGVNSLTGDYSRGASGYVITEGVIGNAVNEVTIAGNLRDMFAALVPADDLILRMAVNVPTLRVDGMTLAGA